MKSGGQVYGHVEVMYKLGQTLKNAGVDLTIDQTHPLAVSFQGLAKSRKA